MALEILFGLVLMKEQSVEVSVEFYKLQKRLRGSSLQIRDFKSRTVSGLTALTGIPVLTEGILQLVRPSLAGRWAGRVQGRGLGGLGYIGEALSAGRGGHGAQGLAWAL